MKTVTVGKNDAGQRLDRFIQKAFPALSSSLIQKSIRKKNIKLNGKRAAANTRLNEGDTVVVYLSDSLLEVSRTSPTWARDATYLKIETPTLNIIYEDENLLLLDKPPGILCHSTKRDEENTLVSHVQAYLYQKGEYRPADENTFSPALCNRIDRNTGGIVVAAKNAETLRTINRKIRQGELDRRYLCLVHGKPNPPSGVLEGYILRDQTNRTVTVHDKPQPKSKLSKTAYSSLKSDGRMSLVECRLLTGRTHQIRAHMLAAGHPIVGDKKYGISGKDDKGYKYQALYSYKLKFDFRTDAGKLNYLNQRTFEVSPIPFGNEILLS